MDDCKLGKILLISNVYPTGRTDYVGTPVCHYFTREWLKLGYDVRVIHFDSLFPKTYYWFGSFFQSLIRAKTGCGVNIDTPCAPQKYSVDGIPVLFVPLRKNIPHHTFSKKVMKKGFDIVCEYLSSCDFKPDVIVGHFILPQLQFLHMFKHKFSDVKTTMVLHGDGSKIRAIYGKNYKIFMESVDVWGFRSIAFKQKFESLYGVQRNEFLCYSGIPEEYVSLKKRSFENGIIHFSFLGSLYKLKRVEDTLRALNIVYGNDAYRFDIIGSGYEESRLKKLVVSLNMEENVIFHGRKKRNEAQLIVEQSDCFIMVSEHEAFGLVYVEAMAKGCITVATRGQGIDGVIIDGENGFLCESKNVDELAKVINKIRNLSAFELSRISKNAINTAAQLTNKKVAESYIMSALNC